jgi:MarR family transcriptional regulator, organic hydroperoxide resistance regulator
MEIRFDYTYILGYKIIKGEVLIKRKLLNAFSEKGYDLTFEQWVVLNVLYSDPGSIQSEIAARTYKDKTNITRILDVLSNKGYITRENHETDRRSSRIYLTEAGKNIFDELIPTVELMDAQFRTGISDAELKMFSKVLDKICRNAEE